MRSDAGRREKSLDIFGKLLIQSIIVVLGNRLICKKGKSKEMIAGNKSWRKGRKLSRSAEQYARLPRLPREIHHYSLRSTSKRSSLSGISPGESSTSMQRMMPSLSITTTARLDMPRDDEDHRDQPPG